MSSVKKIEFTTDLPRGTNKKILEKAFLLTCKELDWSPTGRVLLGFVSTNKIQELNKRFASNDYPTDVLSFSYTEDQPLPKIKDDDSLLVEGEIVICTEIAQKNATSNHVSLESEACLLLIHGILHLSGADHESYAKQASFDAIQSGIMKSLNLKHHSMTW